MDKQEWSIHTMECYPAIGKNEVLIYATPWKNQPWKHHAKWKNSVTKCHILHDSFCIECLEDAKLWRPEVDEWSLKLGRERGVNTNWYKVSFQSDENVLNLDCGKGYRTLWNILKTLELIHFKQVNFMVCELCLRNTVFKKTIIGAPGVT